MSSCICPIDSYLRWPWRPFVHSVALVKDFDLIQLGRRKEKKRSARPRVSFWGCRLHPSLKRGSLDRQLAYSLFCSPTSFPPNKPRWLAIGKGSCFGSAVHAKNRWEQACQMMHLPPAPCQARSFRGLQFCLTIPM